LTAHRLLVEGDGVFANQAHRLALRTALLALLSLAFFATAAPGARATLRVANNNEPAGDPTPITYRLLRSGEPLASVPDFPLGDREDRSFGVSPGTWTFQALPPPGWQVAAINCDGRKFEGEFTIDVANGRVTAVHQDDTHEQTCAFTVRRESASGGQTPPGSGVSPSVPASELPEVVLSKGPALLGVTAGRGFASATVRITRRSKISCQLLRRGTRVVGAERVVRRAGTHEVRVKLKPRIRRRMRARGLERVMLTLRVVVADKKAKQVFRFRALVRL
jgi:hypothetical protein